MSDNGSTNDTTMLGIFTLEDNVPSQPEIVLSNCTDTAMLGQLVTLFEGNPVIRFFLVPGPEGAKLDMTADLYFIKDGSNWVLGSGNTMADVLFDDTGFNPNGTEDTFELVRDNAGNYTITTGETSVAPIDDPLLLDNAEDTIFTEASHAPDTPETEPLYIDPSALEEGQNEIIVNDFNVGSNVLELPEGMTVKDVVVDADNAFTEVIVGPDSDVIGNADIVVRLHGVSQADLPTHEYATEGENMAEDLISQLLNSGLSLE